MANPSHKIILNAFQEIGKSVNKKLYITGLNDTPTSYLGHSGDYLVVNDSQDGVNFTGIEKIAYDLTDYGFLDGVGGGGGSSTGGAFESLPLRDTHPSTDSIPFAIPDAIIAKNNIGNEMILSLEVITENSTDLANNRNLIYTAYKTDYIIYFQNDTNGSFKQSNNIQGTYQQNLKWFVDNDHALYYGGSATTTFDALTDTPVDYVNHSGKYLVVTDGEDGVGFSGIEKIASDLTDYGFGGDGGSSTIPSYTELPDVTENDSKIVSIGCNLYYACEGEWKKVGADTTAPPENTEIPDCISNLEEYNQYQDYVDNVINSNIDIAFDIGFRNLPIDNFFNNVCLFGNNLNVPENLNVSENLNLITQAPSSNEILTSNHINNKYPEAGSYDVLWTNSLTLNNSSAISYNSSLPTITHSDNTVVFWQRSAGYMGWVLPEQYTYVKTGQKFQISMWGGADRATGSRWSKVGHSSHPSSWTTDYISSVSSNQSGEITIEYSFNKLVNSSAPTWHENNLLLIAVFNYGTEYASWYRLNFSVYGNQNLLINMSETAVFRCTCF